MIPMALQQTIFDWFQFREVCDDDRFNIYFNRVLNRDYKLYASLLEVEPDAGKYDWLINQINNNSEESTDNNNLESTVSSVGSNTGTVRDAGSKNNTGTQNNSISGSQDESSNTTGSTIKSGDETDNDSGNTDTTHGGTVITDNTGTQKVDTNNTKTDTTKSTANTDKSNKNTSQDTTTKGIVDNTIITDASGYSEKRSDINKNNPQSISYSGAKAGSIPALNWQYASGQSASEVEHKGDGGEQNTTVSHTGKDVVDRIGSGTDSTTQTQNYNSNTTDEGGQTTTNNLKQTVTDSTTSKTTENNDRKHTYNNVTDTVNQNTTNKLENKQDNTRTDNLTEDHDFTTTNNLKNQNDTTRTDTNNSSHSGSGSSRGQSGSTAELLQLASNFIKQSSAWEWLEGRLEPCFLGIYEV